MINNTLLIQPIQVTDTHLKKPKSWLDTIWSKPILIKIKSDKL
jgi:hypothetical protein